MERDEVLRVAALARLSLSDQEIDEFRTQLTQILDYVATLDEVHVENIDPMPHAIDTCNVFRADVRHESVGRDDVLSNAPRTDGRFFLVPQILDQKDS